MESKHCNTDGRSMCTKRGLFWKINHTQSNSIRISWSAFEFFSWPSYFKDKDYQVCFFHHPNLYFSSFLNRDSLLALSLRQRDTTLKALIKFELMTPYAKGGREFESHRKLILNCCFWYSVFFVVVEIMTRVRLIRINVNNYLMVCDL